MSDRGHNGSGGTQPSQVLMLQPRPKKRPRATPVQQVETASSRRRHELQLEAAFMGALAEHFAQHGHEALERVYSRSPETYLRLVAKVLPQRAGDEPLTAEDVRNLVGLARAVGERLAAARQVSEEQAAND